MPHYCFINTQKWSISRNAHFSEPSSTFDIINVKRKSGITLFCSGDAVYEDYIAANPNSGWGPLADSAMLFVDKELRAQQKKRNLPIIEPVNPVNPKVPAATSTPLNPPPMFPSEATSGR